MRISANSTQDLRYTDHEVSRSIGAANRDLKELDWDGPIQRAIDKAREQGSVAILDAGCGTGFGLVDLKDQVRHRAPIATDLIEALGVSLSDVRSQFTGDRLDERRLYNGFIALQLGNLATVTLQPAHYDVAYSYQVLQHNERIAPVIGNVIPSLRPGGAYYFDTLVDQNGEVADFTAELDPAVWTVDSRELTREFFDGEGTTAVHKITRCAA